MAKECLRTCPRIQELKGKAEENKKSIPWLDHPEFIDQDTPVEQLMYAILHSYNCPGPQSKIVIKSGSWFRKRDIPVKKYFCNLS